MKEQKETHIIEELIPRYCEGNVSEEEFLIVEGWLSQSEEHVHILQQVNALCLAADTVKVKNELNVEKALSDLHKKLKPKRKIYWLRYSQKIAAILFIPLLLLYGFLHFRKEEQSQAEIIQIKTNPGMTTRLVLPDGSIVYLNSESTLEYPSAFNEDTRWITLNGEAFFEIAENKTQQFVVSTFSDARIEVTGTKFNVDAYKDKSFVSVTLIEGKVHFLFKENSQYRRLAMQPGQKTRYDSSISKTELFKTSGRSETAWKDGKIIFEKTPFEEALHMLEKRYHVEFVIKDSCFKNDFFSGEFTSQRLDRILEHFKLSSNIHWRYIETDGEKEEKTKLEIY